MKKILYSLLLCLAVATFSSCDDKNSVDDSSITYFVDLQLNGDAVLFWPKGTSYIEPGYSAVMQGKDVTSDVSVSGEVDVNTSGGYPLTYSAVNKEGYAKESKRTVYVYDTTASSMESGIYSIDKNSYRISSAGKTAYGSSYDIVIIQLEPGVFYVTDFLAGWYDQRAGYGINYAMNGTFRLNADNTIEPISSSVPGWGDSMDGLANGKFDPATKSIYWEISYAGSMTFYITLTK
ncbi:BT_2262 family domain-containing protein [uncultured Bacteroides sp.]|uniref:BT_2262 family domain-containing protein n=1 Tax=uncultured Bacteroides sp. TaxID=162156 RepID=UPI002AAAA1DC|nr:BT_2262 family domain-containing protein [uncultured Bacteroides sp.]